MSHYDELRGIREAIEWKIGATQKAVALLDGAHTILEDVEFEGMTGDTACLLLTLEDKRRGLQNELEINEAAIEEELERIACPACGLPACSDPICEDVSPN